MDEELLSELAGESNADNGGDDAPQAPLSRSSERRARRAEKKRRQQRKRRRLVVLSITLIIVAAMGILGYPVVRDLLQPKEEVALDYPGPGGDPVVVVIMEGSTGAEIAQELVDNDVVRSPRAFIDAYKANRNALSIQPGTYTLKKEMKASDAVLALLDPVNAGEKLMVTPGMTSAQVFERMGSLLDVPVTEIEAAAADRMAIGLPPEAGTSANAIEGWLNPSTYTITPDSTPTTLLKTMIAGRVAELKELEIPKAQWETALIRASIIEKEVNREEDYGKVARAIQNRLDIDMALQSDAVVKYGLPDHTGANLAPDDRGGTDNRYNVYYYKGLPPTPISNPGNAAIAATVSPPAGPWLYWVTVNLETGETKFAQTYEEHQVNVNQYRSWYKAWCKEDESRCS